MYPGKSRISDGDINYRFVFPYLRSHLFLPRLPPLFLFRPPCLPCPIPAKVSSENHCPGCITIDTMQSAQCLCGVRRFRPL